ncbi:MAG: hypothetical protein NT040_04025 [Bacteroidetes bacterium]|nr:hypothetical protein [Bacteroidota bacterium]
MKVKYIHLIIFGFWFFSCVQVFAQAPPPPPDGAKGSANNKAPGGGGAPLDASPFVLPLLAAGYGAVKWYRARVE